MNRLRLQVGVLLGGTQNETQEQMKDVIEFETKIAEITLPEEDLRDEMKFYHLMSIADLQKKAPFVSNQFPSLAFFLVWGGVKLTT